jgi:hypothetical protein
MRMSIKAKSGLVSPALAMASGPLETDADTV